MEIRKAQYGFSQSNTLATKKLAVDLKAYGYYKVPKTNGLQKRKSCPISCTLVVNDFGVSDMNKVDAEHLKVALKKQYPMTVDWSGENTLLSPSTGTIQNKK